MDVCSRTITHLQLSLENIQTGLARYHNSRGEFCKDKRCFLCRRIKWADLVLIGFMLQIIDPWTRGFFFPKLEYTDTDGSSLNATEKFDIDTHLRSKRCCSANIDICWLHCLAIYFCLNAAQNLNWNVAGTKKSDKKTNVLWDGENRGKCIFFDDTIQPHRNRLGQRDQIKGGNKTSRKKWDYIWTKYLF